MSHYSIEDVVVKKFLQILTAALLVFLTGTTRTWIISSNLLLLADCCGFFLLFFNQIPDGS